MIEIPEITQAVAKLRAGELVAFPTETVYGLGADARNPAAICKIFTIKERPYDHPLIVHIASGEQLSDWALEITTPVLALANAFWPGPLTMVLKKQSHVLDIVTGGQATVGVRVPSHPLAQALLTAFGGGLVAPSANKFTHISPTTAQAVYEEFGSNLGLVLDGGPCSVGLESTIVDMSGNIPVILRPGMITADAIAAVLKSPVSMRRQDASGIRTPGMHHLHYAPTTRTVLVPTSILASYLRALQPKDLPAAVVTHSGLRLLSKNDIYVTNMFADAQVYAHDIYHSLRSLDQQHFKQIIIEDVPEGGEWLAIRDRLSKATAQR